MTILYINVCGYVYKPMIDTHMHARTHRHMVCSGLEYAGLKKILFLKLSCILQIFYRVLSFRSKKKKKKEKSGALSCLEPQGKHLLSLPWLSPRAISPEHPSRSRSSYWGAQLMAEEGVQGWEEAGSRERRSQP